MNAMSYQIISFVGLCPFHSQELDSSLETLTTAFEKATSEKLGFQQEVNRTNKTIELANRLVKGLEVSTAAANLETGLIKTDVINIRGSFLCMFRFMLHVSE